MTFEILTGQKFSPKPFYMESNAPNRSDWQLFQFQPNIQDLDKKPRSLFQCELNFILKAPL